MSLQPFSILELSGTPHEIGRLHGQQARDLIQNSIANYRFLFKDSVGLEWPQVQRLARKYINPINAYDPELLEEMEGIAAGSGLVLEDIIAINARTELLYSNASDDTEGCTAVTVMPEKTDCQRLLWGQNWDYGPLVANSLLIFRIKQTHKLEIIMVAEAGQIGKIGINSCGMTTGLNALSAPSDPQGIPVHVALRIMLNSNSLTSGTTFLETIPVAGCGNLIFGSPHEVLYIEIGPDDFDVLYPTDGILVHANHYLSPRFYMLKNSKNQRAANTYIRNGRMRYLYNTLQQPVSIEDMKRIFADHSDYPDSICRHPREDRDPGKRVKTNYSVIFDPTMRQMHLACGNPCSTPYEVYTVSNANEGTPR